MVIMGMVSWVIKAILDGHLIIKQAIQRKTTGATLVTLTTVNVNIHIIISQIIRSFLLIIIIILCNLQV